MYDIGVESKFTPLGEPKPRLSFKQKIKQLQRPWQHCHGAQPPSRIIWATSKHADREQPGVRPWCVSAEPVCKRNAINQTGGDSGYCNNSQTLPRRKPTTGTSAPSSNSRNPRTWGGFTSLLNDSGLEEVEPDLRLDGTKAATKNAPIRVARAPAKGTRRHLDGEIKATDEQPLESTAEEPLQSFLCAPSFCSSITTEETAKDYATGAHYPPRYVDTTPEDYTDPQDREDNDNDTQRGAVVPTTVDSSSNNSNTIEGALDNSQRASSTQDTVSSDVMMPGSTRSTPFITPCDEDITSPRIAAERGSIPVSGKRDFCCIAKGEVGPEPEADEAPDESDVEGGGQVDRGPSIGGRVFLEMMLPQLGKGRGTRHKEGSRSTRSIIKDEEAVLRGRSQIPDARRGVVYHLAGEFTRVPRDVDEPPPIDITSPLPTSAFEGVVGSDEGKLETDEAGDSEEQQQQAHGRDNANLERAVKPFRPPYIGVLGYYVEDGCSQSRSSPNSALYGRALVSNNSRPRSVSSRRPDTPAVVIPGRQPFSPVRPLSPTNSLGSPPRRHRNSNWGEQGVPLALEEQEHSRSTVPYVVSGTMLGWKLSTRGRKKSLEESLKAFDYSEHHLIPVYGFRSCVDESERTAVRERRLELQRVEARALAAERAALKRRVRAEGGEGGAAFARTMSRRALARADWIQKMGDALDARKENLWRRSSPEVVRAYRKHVGNRVHRERSRKRAERGLTLRRLTPICAVTSRADIPGARETLERRPSQKNYCASEGDNFTEDIARELHLMLVRARRRQVSQKEKGVPLCSGCLCRCKGTCSSGSRSCFDDTFDDKCSMEIDGSSRLLSNCK